jgi:hypothetical protein
MKRRLQEGEEAPAKAEASGMGKIYFLVLFVFGFPVPQMLKLAHLSLASAKSIW